MTLGVVVAGVPCFQPGNPAAGQAQRDVSGARFDHDYDLNRHMPLIKQPPGEDCLGYSVGRGLAGAAPGSAMRFVATCRIYFASLERFSASVPQHGPEPQADVGNDTDSRR